MGPHLPFVGTMVENLRTAGGVFLLLLETIRSLFGRWPRRRVLVDQFFLIGVRSMPVILTTGLFTGMVLAVQSFNQFRRVNITSMVGAVVGVSMVKELGPVLTGLMLAGRVGAAITAEVGTMTVTEQVDALRSLATNPVRWLVLPRVLACVLLTPFLTLMADLIGIAGGTFICVNVLNVEWAFHYANLLDWLTVWDISVGCAKSSCFGLLIALVASYKGFNTEPGAAGVGKAATEAVVTSCILILVSDFFLSVLFAAIRPEWAE
ncbi:MAG: ABC transporter permease [Candidatus Brocadiae bacterium]|nr:ABC transporter permease [Candidatus Brocadiia bacterium]